MVAYLEDIGARNIAAIHINNEYGNAYIDAVGSEFWGTISLREKINDEEKDFTLIAKKIAGSIDDIDALIIVFVSESQNVSIIKSLDSEGVLEALDRNVIGGEGFLTDAVLADVGEMADGLKWTQFPQIGNLGGDSGSFIEAYKANYEIGSGDVFVVLHAESFHLIIDAIREVGNDGDAVAKYISSITQDTPRSGLFGDYYFKGSDAQALNFVVFEAKGGELQPLEK